MGHITDSKRVISA